MKKWLSGAFTAVACIALLLVSSGCGNNSSPVDSTDSTYETDPKGIIVDVDNEDVVKDGSGNNNGGGGNNSKKGDSDATSNRQSSSTANSNTGGKDPFANIPQRLKGSTVVFAHWGDEGAEEYQKVIKAFTQKTGIKVKLVSYPQSEYISTISKQIASKAGPDVVISSNTFPTILDICQPLQNYIDLKDDFWDDTIIEETTIGGNTYMVNSLESCWTSTYLVFYNKKIFSENGLTSPLDYYKNGKWTYENLKKCMEQVKALGYIGGSVDAEAMSTSLGQPFIKYDRKTATFINNSANVTEAYQFHTQNVKEGLWSFGAWWGTFNNGNIGLFMATNYGLKYNGFFKDLDRNSLGAVPLPSSYKGKACITAGGFRAYGIAKGAPNPEGSAYFLRYFLDYSYYKAAGANVFMNKECEEVYFKEVIPLVKKQGIIYNHTAEPMALAGYPNFSLYMNDVEQVDVAQVATAIAAKKNVVDNAVNKANETISKYKK